MGTWICIGPSCGLLDCRNTMAQTCAPGGAKEVSLLIRFSLPRLVFSFFHFKLPLSFLWSLEFISLLTAAKTTLGFALLIGCQTRCFWKGDPILEVPRASLNCLFVGRCRIIFSSPHMQYHLLSGLYLDGARPAGQGASLYAWLCLFIVSSPRTISLEFGCLVFFPLHFRPTTRLGGLSSVSFAHAFFYDIWAGRNLRCGIAREARALLTQIRSDDKPFHMLKNVYRGYESIVPIDSYPHQWLPFAGWPGETLHIIIFLYSFPSIFVFFTPHVSLRISLRVSEPLNQAWGVYVFCDADPLTSSFLLCFVLAMLIG